MTSQFRIARVQRTLRYFEEDIPLLNIRVKDLSRERQESARNFLACMIARTRAELDRLRQQLPPEIHDSAEAPCEPAD
jgi:hypothetical protein